MMDNEISLFAHLGNLQCWDDYTCGITEGTLYVFIDDVVLTLNDFADRVLGTDDLIRIVRNDLTRYESYTCGVTQKDDGDMVMHDDMMQALRKHFDGTI